MISPISYQSQPISQQPQYQQQATDITLFENPNTSINMDFFMGNPVQVSNGVIDVTPDTEPQTKKRGRPPKNKDEVKVIGGENVIVESSKSENLPMTYSNESYASGYQETRGMLKNTCEQVDTLSYLVMQDIQKVRDSQMRSKYNVLPGLYSALSGVMSTKLGAIKEMNKSTTDGFNLDMKRMKEMSASMSDRSPEQQIMDMYNAFISTPVGTGGYMVPPNTLEMTAVGMNGIVRSDLGNADAGYSNYVNNLTPTQNAMRLEHNPNIKTVVVYDYATGAKYFDVMDVSTGQSVPNIDRPDQMFMQDTIIDMKHNVARNTKLDTTYPLIVYNKDSSSLY